MRSWTFAFVARVHTLVDLVDDTEWCLSKVLQSHQIEDSRYSALTTRLAIGVEDRHRLAISVFESVVYVINEVEKLTGSGQISGSTRR
jgi:hypothetical protein